MTPPTHRGASAPGRRAGTGQSPRSKRAAILDAATRQFADNGYDAAKWADIAEAVGIGQTALYHYFASKAHCLFTIMADALRDHRDHFAAVRRENRAPREVIVAAMQHVFELDEMGVLRYRVVQSEISLLGLEHDVSGPERSAHGEARSYARDLNRDWTTYLDSAMQAGSIPPQDPYVLAHSVLGLSSQIFQWYTPDSRVTLDQLAKVVTAQALAMVFDAPGYFAGREAGGAGGLVLPA